MKRLAPFAGWTALIFGFLALLVYITLPAFVLWTAAFGGLALINAVFFGVVDRARVQSALKSRQAIHGLNSATLIAVMVGILIFLNLLVFRHKDRFDFTETGFFTLAPQTQKIVRGLPRDVKVTAFFSGAGQTRDGFLALMEGYQALTDKIDLQMVDPDKSPAIAKQYGITTYGSVAFESGGKSTQINKPTEENFTNALLQVTTDISKKIYFLKGHGEKSIDQPAPKNSYKARQALEQDGFQVDTLLLLQAGAAPEDADLLIINGPKKILPRLEQEAIEAYLNRGGRVLLMIDPQTEIGAASFLRRWGIDLEDDLIVDPLSKLFGGDDAAPVVNQYGEHGIMKDFALPTIFPVLRSVRPVNSKGIETTELLFSGPNSWAETEYRQMPWTFDKNKDSRGPLPVAVAVTKTLTAPPGEASGPAGADANTPAPASDAAGSSGEPFNPAKKASLVVIGDSDFATDQYFDFSGNGDFFSNTASWLLQEETLISIRPRERKNTPLPLTSTQGNLTFVLGTIVFPGAVLLLGVRVWWRRRGL
ncbi:MAG: GldG family protein [Nitrospinaceae bacterium]